VRADPRQVDLAAGEGVQRPVVGVRVDAPAFLVGQVRQRGPVGDAQELQDPEYQVAVGAGVGHHDLREFPAVQPEDHIDHVQRVADGAGHHLRAPPHALVIHCVQPGHPAFGAEELAVGADRTRRAPGERSGAAEPAPAR
jgi:hypothetical protein